MNLSEWGQFLSTKGIELHDQLGCGVIDRYPLSMQLVGKPAQITSIIVKIQLASALKKIHRKEVRDLLKHKATISYMGKIIQLTIRTGNMQYPYDFSQTVVSLISYLANNNIPESTQCPICGRFDSDAMAYYNGAYQKVHMHCIQNVLDTREASVEENETNGSFFTGLIGALLGGLVGIIPSLLTIFLLQRIYVMLYALIPICIYYGYRLFKGRMNQWAVVLTILLSFLILFVMEYVVLVISVHREYGIWLLKECLQLFFDRQYFLEMLKDMVMSFVFLALGILYSWRMIAENNQKTTTSIEFTRGTIRPIIPDDREM